MTSKMINWENVFSKSEEFQNNQPFPYGFIENIFHSDFYNELYGTYPKIDSHWYKPTDYSRSATKRGFGNHFPAKGDRFPEDQEDENLSSAWNEFFHYLHKLFPLGSTCQPLFLNIFRN